MGPLRTELRGLLKNLQSRGILEEDLPDATRRSLIDLRRQLAQSNATAARQGLEAVRLVAATASVDRTLVEAKLRRVDQRLRATQGSPEKMQPLRERASLALQEFMDGRYETANGHLNRILSALAKGTER